MDDDSSDSGTEVDPRPSSHIHTITGKLCHVAALYYTIFGSLYMCINRGIN